MDTLQTSPLWVTKVSIDRTALTSSSYRRPSSSWPFSPSPLSCTSSRSMAPSLGYSLGWWSSPSAVSVSEKVQLARAPRLTPSSLPVEILGWAGRLWSHYSVMSDGFLMQICCLVIAPTFISAGLVSSPRRPLLVAEADHCRLTRSTCFSAFSSTRLHLRTATCPLNGSRSSS